MKLLALTVLLFTLAGCSRRDEEHARKRARQTAQELKHESEQALHKAEKEADKADRELKADLGKAREKTNEALRQRNNPAERDRQ